MGRIVVGVDGSPRAQAALDWAATEARLRGAWLEVVHAFRYPVAGELPLPLSPGLDVLTASGRALVDRALAPVNVQGIELRTRIEPGPAPAVLLAAAEGADLLVVGSRGRGGFSGLLLGSVSQQCAHHAPCPVVILPHESERPRH